MGKRVTAFLCFLTIAAAALAAADGRFTLVIDAGHGGHDAGASGRFSKEKNINLNVALAVGKYVERNLPTVKVVYTRKSDVFVPLHERADIANKAKADLFISIHTNAMPSRRIARGIETYTLGMHRAADNLDVAKRENSVILFESDYKQHYEGFDPNSSESYILFEFIQDRNMAKSVELARFVQKRACAATGRQNKGVKQAGFLVLRETSMPSCLVELGFITTSDEEQYLNSKKGIDALARGIYLAFADYMRKYDNKTAAPTSKAKADDDKKTDEPEEEKPSRRERRKAEREARKKREEAEKAAEEAKKEAKESGTDVASELRQARLGASGNAKASAMATPTKPVVVVPEWKATEPKAPAEAKGDTATATPAKSHAIVFKVQLLASSRSLPATSAQFKGVEGVECYSDGGLYKYTSGASADYDEISRLRRTLAEKFPQAFIVAFKDGQRIDTAEALRQAKANKTNGKK